MSPLGFATAAPSSPREFAVRNQQSCAPYRPVWPLQATRQHFASYSPRNSPARRRRVHLIFKYDKNTEHHNKSWSTTTPCLLPARSVQNQDQAEATAEGCLSLTGSRPSATCKYQRPPRCINSPAGFLFSLFSRFSVRLADASDHTMT